jgi:histidinol dehydrogenase
MKLIKHPAPELWEKLNKRPSNHQPQVEQTVRSILQTVREEGDFGLQQFIRQFETTNPKSLFVGAEEILAAEALVDLKLKASIDVAVKNITTFHKAQVAEEMVVETMPGVVCSRKSIPIERVGLYIPGGTAPLFSTLLMLGIPARLAGCKELVLCTPGDKNGNIHPAILYTANLLQIQSIIRCGGAHGIAAMAYGTESIPPVNKIFGPGNQYVTAAKRQVSAEGVAIDMPAGPSELLVIADQHANPAFVAADLLSQAEHGADSQVVLVTNSEKLAEKVAKELEQQLLQLPRKDIASQALKNSFSIIVNNLQEAMQFSNKYAPEHLIINTIDPIEWADKVVNAGSVFLGPYAAEAVGDYASGTNHTLPTAGFARAFSGVSLDSFVKKVTFQHLSKEGLKSIGPHVMTMAEAEGLDGHANAIKVRMQ